MQTRACKLRRDSPLVTLVLPKEKTGSESSVTRVARDLTIRLSITYRSLHKTAPWESVTDPSATGPGRLCHGGVC